MPATCASHSAGTSASSRTTAMESMPCFQAFRLETALPRRELGPVCAICEYDRRRGRNGKGAFVTDFVSQFCVLGLRSNSRITHRGQCRFISGQRGSPRLLTDYGCSFCAQKQKIMFSELPP